MSDLVAQLEQRVATLQEQNEQLFGQLQDLEFEYAEQTEQLLDTENELSRWTSSDVTTTVSGTVCLYFNCNSAEFFTPLTAGQPCIQFPIANKSYIRICDEYIVGQYDPTTEVCLGIKKSPDFSMTAASQAAHLTKSANATLNPNWYRTEVSEGYIMIGSMMTQPNEVNHPWCYRNHVWFLDGWKKLSFQIDREWCWIEPGSPPI